MNIWLLFPALPAVMFCATAAVAQTTITSAEIAPLSGSAPVDYYDGLRAWENNAPDLAVSLWLRAAAYGDGRSMERIGDLYASGDILPAQPLLAAQYRALAVAFGEPVAGDPFAGLDEEQKTAVRTAIASFKPAAIPGAGLVPEPDDFEALINAIYSAPLDKIEEIYSAGNLWNKTDKNDWTALFHAVASGRPEVVEFLLKDTPQLRRVAGDNRFSLLHVAAWSGNADIADMLVNAGAFPIAETSAGMRPSDVAKQAGHDELAAQMEGRERSAAKDFQAHLNELGYDVGKPDGELGPRSRMQIAILGNAINHADLMSPAYLYVAAEKQKTEDWGIIYSYTKSEDSSTWETYQPSVHALSAEDAEANALEECKAQDGVKACSVDAVLPKGSCVSRATTDSVWEWSKIFASQQAADTAAMTACKDQGGGSDCKISASFCAGMQ